jgi:hypothetical protein
MPGGVDEDNGKYIRENGRSRFKATSIVLQERLVTLREGKTSPEVLCHASILRSPHPSRRGQSETMRSKIERRGTQKARNLEPSVERHSQTTGEKGERSQRRNTRRAKVSSCWEEIADAPFWPALELIRLDKLGASQWPPFHRLGVRPQLELSFYASSSSFYGLWTVLRAGFVVKRSRFRQSVRRL